MRSPHVPSVVSLSARSTEPKLYHPATDAPTLIESAILNLGSWPYTLFCIGCGIVLAVFIPMIAGGLWRMAAVR